MLKTIKKVLILVFIAAIANAALPDANQTIDTTIQILGLTPNAYLGAKLAKFKTTSGKTIANDLDKIERALQRHLATKHTRTQDCIKTLRCEDCALSAHDRRAVEAAICTKIKELKEQEKIANEPGTVEIAWPNRTLHVTNIGAANLFLSQHRTSGLGYTIKDHPKYRAAPAVPVVQAAAPVAPMRRVAVVAAKEDDCRAAAPITLLHKPQPVVASPSSAFSGSSSVASTSTGSRPSSRGVSAFRSLFPAVQTGSPTSGSAAISPVSNASSVHSFSGDVSFDSSDSLPSRVGSASPASARTSPHSNTSSPTVDFDDVALELEDAPRAHSATHTTSHPAPLMICNYAHNDRYPKLPDPRKLLHQSKQPSLVTPTLRASTASAFLAKAYPTATQPYPVGTPATPAAAPQTVPLFRLPRQLPPVISTRSSKPTHRAEISDSAALPAKQAVKPLQLKTTRDEARERDARTFALLAEQKALAQKDEARREAEAKEIRETALMTAQQTAAQMTRVARTAKKEAYQAQQERIAAHREREALEQAAAQKRRDAKQAEFLEVQRIAKEKAAHLKTEKQKQHEARTAAEKAASQARKAALTATPSSVPATSGSDVDEIALEFPAATTPRPAVVVPASRHTATANAWFDTELTGNSSAVPSRREVIPAHLRAGGRYAGPDGMARLERDERLYGGRPQHSSTRTTAVRQSPTIVPSAMPAPAPQPRLVPPATRPVSAPVAPQATPSRSILNPMRWATAVGSGISDGYNALSMKGAKFGSTVSQRIGDLNRDLDAADASTCSVQ